MLNGLLAYKSIKPSSSSPLHAFPVFVSVTLQLSLLFLSSLSLLLSHLLSLYLALSFSLCHSPALSPFPAFLVSVTLPLAVFISCSLPLSFLHCSVCGGVWGWAHACMHACVSLCVLFFLTLTSLKENHDYSCGIDWASLCNILAAALSHFTLVQDTSVTAITFQLLLKNGGNFYSPLIITEMEWHARLGGYVFSDTVLSIRTATRQFDILDWN